MIFSSLRKEAAPLWRRFLTWMLIVAVFATLIVPAKAVSGETFNLTLEGLTSIGIKSDLPVYRVTVDGNQYDKIDFAALTQATTCNRICANEDGTMPDVVFASNIENTVLENEDEVFEKVTQLYKSGKADIALNDGETIDESGDVLLFWLLTAAGRRSTAAGYLIIEWNSNNAEKETYNLTLNGINSIGTKSDLPVYRMTVDGNQYDKIDFAALTQATTCNRICANEDGTMPDVVFASNIENTVLENEDEVFEKVTQLYKSGKADIALNDGETIDESGDVLLFWLLTAAGRRSTAAGYLIIEWKNLIHDKPIIDKTTLNSLTVSVNENAYYTTNDRYNGKTTSANGFWADMQSVLSAAKEINENSNATQTQVDKAVTDLSAAIGSLIPVSQINPTYLYETIQKWGYSDEYLADFTESSVAKYKTALNNAQNYLNGLFDADGKATSENIAANQTKADGYADALKNAHIVPKESVDYAKTNVKTINSLLNRFPMTENNGKYTSTSWDEFVSVSNEAKAYIAEHPVTDEMTYEEEDKYSTYAQNLWDAAYGLTPATDSIKVEFIYTDDYLMRNPETRLEFERYQPISKEITLNSESGYTLEALYSAAGVNEKQTQHFEGAHFSEWNVLVNGTMICKVHATDGIKYENIRLNDGDVVQLVHMDFPLYAPVYGLEPTPWEMIENDLGLMRIIPNKQSVDKGESITFSVERANTHLWQFSGAYSPYSGAELAVYGPKNEDGSYPTTPTLTDEFSNADGSVTLSLKESGEYLITAFEPRDNDRKTSYFPSANVAAPYICITVSDNEYIEECCDGIHYGGTEIKDAVEATCTSTGYSGDTYCRGCGEMITEGEMIEALGHDYTIPGISGSTHWLSCSVCGAIDPDSYTRPEAPKPDTGSVRVIVENNTYKVAEGAPWDGILVDEWVTLNDNSTMMSCIVSALINHGYTQTGAENNYISKINGLGEFDGGNGSGWMGTLNDWFTNEGFGAFTVANGKLADGDIIEIMYTCKLGADLGSSFDSNDTRLANLTISGGRLSPDFDSDKTEYTLTISGSRAKVEVGPTAMNKNFMVKTFLNEKVTGNEEGSSFYKRTETIPVNDGDVIYIGVGEAAWPTMNEGAEGTWYTVKVVGSGSAPAPGGSETKPETQPLSFVDVAEGSYYADAVAWAVANGITDGVDKTHFAPDASCTRAQVVTFLWRAAGAPEPTATKCDFVDLDENAYYFKAVLWAVENGITDGVDATHFAPNADVTRAQVVTFQYRAAKANAEGSNSFVDVPTGAYYEDAVNWAVKSGITNGVDETHFAPNASCTRAQIVTFLYRAAK